MTQLDANYIAQILSGRSAFTPSSLTMTKMPRLLDLFCGAGGATKGYQRAGFYVVGLDHKPQPRYCGDEFVLGNVIEWLNENVSFVKENFEGIHASPPCQAYSLARQNNETTPDLIRPLRPVLQELELPYVIENVRNSPLNKTVVLCGSMFGLQTYRDRLFETNFPVNQPPHVKHLQPVAPMGRPIINGEFVHVIGNFSDAEAGRRALNIDWMSRDEIREAIPPAFTSYIGVHLREFLGHARR